MRLRRAGSLTARSQRTLAGTARRISAQAVEHAGGDLGGLVERAEDDAARGEAEGRARRRRGGERLIGVAHHEARRHPDQVLGEERVLARRRGHVVGDEVVDEGRTERCGVPEVVDLDGRRPPGEDGKPVIGRVAAEVDEDVDLVVGDPARGGVRMLVADVDEAIGRGGDLVPVPAVVVPAVGVGEYLDFRPIVRAEERARELPHRVIPEIAREVPDAEPLARRGPAAPEDRCARVQPAGVKLGDLPARLGRDRREDGIHRRDVSRPVRRALVAPLEEAVERARCPRPIAGVEQRPQHVGPGDRQIGLEPDRRAVMLECRVGLREPAMHVRQIHVRVRVVGIERDGAGEECRRVVEPPERGDDDPELHVRRPRVGRRGDRLAQARLGGGEIAGLVEGATTADQRLRGRGAPLMTGEQATQHGGRSRRARASRCGILPR